ncbi:hypothetical protein [Pontimicrobium sp. MEBiC01747]|jgi:hypothetical protein
MADLTNIFSNKEYINKDVFERHLKKVCRNQNLKIKEDEEDIFIISKGDDLGYISIDLPNVEDFNSTFGIIEDYGSISQMDYKIPDHATESFYIPFITELMDEFPDMLIDNKTLSEHLSIQEDE